jgi:uncharacterized protein with LGFP repeats
VNNATLRDQWIKTVTRYYNGCLPGWSCWSSRYAHYNDSLSQVLSDTGGTAYWRDAGNSISCAGGSGTVIGAIADKYKSLGGCTSVLGRPTSNELPCADGQGRYSTFEIGSIYWRSDIGAFEVHGAIRDKWKALGWENGFVGYPLTDELGSPDGRGRYSVFQGANIYWTPQTGAHEVHGAIRDKWKELGWELGALGYPTSDEYAISGGRRSDFEHGSISWASATGKVTVTNGTVSSN